MKLNKILCAAAVACVTMVASTVSAMAAQSFTIGKPIDLTTGAEVETFTAGQYIAFPVKVTSDTGNAFSFQFAAAYDSALTPGIDETVASDESSAIYDNLDELGAAIQNAADSRYAFMDCDYYIYKKVVKLSNADPILVNTAFSGGTEVMVGMSYNEGTTLKSDVQFYALFTVNSDVSGLNKQLLTINGAKSSINTDTQETKTNPDVEQEEVNKCAAAFKLSFEPSEMEYYIHGLSIKVNGGEAKAITDYVENGTKIEFPVRLVGDASSVEVEITASIGATESVADDTKVLYSGTLALNPTDYVAVN